MSKNITKLEAIRLYSKSSNPVGNEVFDLQI